MLTKLSDLVGTLVAIGLVVAGLWGWGAAAHLARSAGEPELTFWAIRSAAIAALAAAQVLAMTFFVDAVYSRDRAGEWIRLGAGALCAIAFIGALTLGALGR